jgi:hypothetical protein
MCREKEKSVRWQKDESVRRQEPLWCQGQPVRSKKILIVA